MTSGFSCQNCYKRKRTRHYTRFRFKAAVRDAIFRLACGMRSDIACSALNKWTKIVSTHSTYFPQQHSSIFSLLLRATFYERAIYGAEWFMSKPSLIARMPNSHTDRLPSQYGTGALFFRWIRNSSRSFCTKRILWIANSVMKNENKSERKIEKNWYRQPENRSQRKKMIETGALTMRETNRQR